MEGQDRMSAEQSEADLTKVKERVVPAVLCSRLLRYFNFLFQVHSSCLFARVNVPACLFVSFHWKMSFFLTVRQVALCNLPTAKADLEHVRKVCAAAAAAAMHVSNAD